MYFKPKDADPLMKYSCIRFWSTMHVNISILVNPLRLSRVGENILLQVYLYYTITEVYTNHAKAHLT